MIDKYITRALGNPANKWNWYELGKRGVSLDEAMAMARKLGCSDIPVREGYAEYRPQIEITIL